MRVLGRTGVRVSPLALGAMAFASGTEDEGVKVIHKALDAGINFVDTADMYSRGESELVVGKALKGRRDDVVLATKFYGPMGDDPNQRGTSRRWVMRAVEDSLRRLGTDWIDLYQVHRPEPETDFAETLGALTDLVQAGKIRYVGTSTFPASEIVEGQWLAERRNLARVVCEQPPYSLLNRAVEREVLPVAQRYGMGVIPWSPLAAGWLSGKYRKGRPPPDTVRAKYFRDAFDMANPANSAKVEAAEAYAVLAEEAGMPLIHLALAFVIGHPAVTAAITGPRTAEQLDLVLEATEVTLSPDVLDQIDKIVPPGTSLLGWGYDPPSIADPARRRRHDGR